MKPTVCPALLLFFFLSGNALFGQSGRGQENINQDWQFYLGNFPSAQAAQASSQNWQKVNLPHTWNDQDIVDEKKGYRRGEAWYKKDLDQTFDPAQFAYTLHFEGVGQEAEVFLNGNSLGKHLGGYTAFQFSLNNYLKPNQNQLLVKVSNALNRDLPPIDGDFNMFGGIYRDVFLIRTDKIHFDMQNKGSQGVFVETPQVSAQRGTATIRGRVHNEFKQTEKLRVRAIIYDPLRKLVQNQEAKLSAQAGQFADFSFSLQVDNPQLWSPENPNLYQIQLEVFQGDQKRASDVLTLPLGFRWWSLDAQTGLRLNGQPYVLRGASRHQDYAGLGNALSNELHIQDMENLKAMGANFVRIAHYPQDPAVLEACDRLGLLVWEEIPVVTSIHNSEGFRENAKEMLREMIRQHYNHPSVMIWGYLNEVLLYAKAQDQAKISQGFTLAQELEQVAKSEDPNRLTALAQHGNFNLTNASGMNQVPDVVGFNIYFGWYGGIKPLVGNLDGNLKLNPPRPTLISEYGAGSDPRIHSLEPKRFDFSEEHAFFVHQTYLKELQTTRPYLIGSAIWNLNDFSSNIRGDAVPFINSKGIFTFDRQPKDVYYLYKVLWKPEEPLVHIASQNWQYRVGEAETEGAPFSFQEVQVFSNLPEIELILNNRTLTTQKVVDGIAKFDVPFLAGENTLEARGQRRGKTYQDKIKIQFRLHPYLLREKEPFTPIYMNLGAPFYFVDKTRKLCWEPEKAYRQGSYGYLGGEAFTISKHGGRFGTDRNIENSELDPLFQTRRDGRHALKFDVPDGTYELTLYFAEINQGQSRAFIVDAEGQRLLDGFSPRQEVGNFKMVAKKFKLEAKNQQGIQIRLSDGFVNAVSLEKL